MVGGGSSSNPKAEALLAPGIQTMSIQADEAEPPSYDDVRSIRSVNAPIGSGIKENSSNLTEIQDSVEFEYAFQVDTNHPQLATTVIRRPDAKTTILALTRLALGPRKVVPNDRADFTLGGAPLNGNQLEIYARGNPQLPIRSIKVAMLDILEDDPDLQFGVFNLKNRTGATPRGIQVQDVMFDRGYQIPPDVLCFLTDFAFGPGFQWKGNQGPAQARKIKAGHNGTGQFGFHPIFVSPGTSLPIEGQATWVAVPKDTRRFDCGVFEIIAKSPFPPSFTGTIDYTKWKFPKKNPPKLFIGISGFEFDGSRPLRVSTAVTGESHQGFSWAVRSWDDATMPYTWSVTVSWLAIATAS